MKRFAILAALAVLFGAATYSIKINPGDTVTVEAVTTPVPPLVTPPPPVTAATIPLGVNLTGPDDWNMGARARVFVDVMKTARCIQGAVGADGWPSGASKWRVLTTSNNQAPELNWSTAGSRQPKIAGTYLLSWTGAATVTAAGATVKNIVGTTADVVIASDSVDIDLNFSAPVKAIQLLRPGYPRGTTQTVTNEFKAFVAPFTTIRFMDAMMTNWADPEDAAVRFASLGADKRLDWNERPPAAYATYNTPWGLPIEAVVKICNETKRDPWICIPWCATDDYLTGLAIYLKASLDPARTVYYEWGNELWNYAYGFYHSGLFRDEAVAYATASTAPKLANPADNPYYYSARYAAKRTIDAATIFRAQSVNSRAILSSQFANPSFIADALNWALRSYPNPPSYYLAGIACAPYIGAGGATVDEILAGLNADVATRKANDSNLMNWRAMADAYGLPVYNYEAGIDLGQGTTNLTPRIAAAYDARIKATARAYLESCYLDGGLASLMWFNGICTRDKWGPAWGLTDDVADLAQPMYSGARAFAMTAAPTGGVTATFYKDTSFTTALGTITVPLVNHRWQIWSTGGIFGRKDVTTTDARNGSIRFTGRYTGPGTLTVEKETNDVATLTRDGDKFALSYKAIFDGNGIAWVRLVAGGAVVRQAQLLAQ